MSITSQEILNLIASKPELNDLVNARNDGAIAEALSVGRTKIISRIISARGLAEAIGPLTAELILLKLEAARDNMLASSNDQIKLMGSLLRRQLSFLSNEGLDFGSLVLRSMIDQYGALWGLTIDEINAIKSIALISDPIPVNKVSSALNGE